MRYIEAGKAFQQLRLAAGKSQRDVAKIFQLGSVQFVSNWERGICLPPRSYLKRLAKLYRVQPRHLGRIFVQEYEKEMARYV